MPTKHGKSSGTVLTSIENIHMINEKEKQGKSSDEGGETMGAGKKSETDMRIETKKAVKQIHNVAP